MRLNHHPRLQFWTQYAGVVFAGFTMKELFPAAMSLLPGIQAGALTMKRIMPMSATLGLLILLKPIVFVPIYLAFFLAFFQ